MKLFLHEGQGSNVNGGIEAFEVIKIAGDSIASYISLLK